MEKPSYKSRDFGSPLEPELEEQDPQSVPIHTLQSLSAPVVCPKCGVRAMTLTRLKSGSFALGRTEVLAYPEVNGAEDENKDEVEVEVKVEDKSRESHLL
uniref:LITAF domain-containing protein n=1 Tax=Fusarium oxysporum (strain Fo5176) TaxID=660025 RepID=A0A0D2XLT4_FUSOF